MVKRRLPRIISLALVLGIAGSMLIGCQKKASDIKEDTSNLNTAGTLPIVKKPVTLTWWMNQDSNDIAAGIMMGDTASIKEWEKRTGIEIKFQQPALGQETTQFNLMIASGTLPDLITWDWSTYPGGPDKALSDDIVINHNSLISKYATNFNKFVKDHPAIEKEYKTDSGETYCIPSIMTYDKNGKAGTTPDKRDLLYESYQGPIVRSDWMKDLGLSTPATISDWTNVLTQFKEKKGATAPLTFTLATFKTADSFMGAYGITYSFYQDTGKKIHFGPSMPQYKDFLTQFNAWYKAGLLDPDFATINSTAMNAKCMNGKSGAWIGTYASNVGAYIQTMVKTNPSYDLVGVLNPTLNKGDTTIIGQKDNPYRQGSSVSITTTNKYPIESTKFIDYLYSNDGDRLVNWGIEGTNYKVVNGEPQYTDAIVNNPKFAAQVAVMLYRFKNGPFAMDYANRLATLVSYGTNRPKEAIDTWSKCTQAVALPATTIAPEKATAYANVMKDINTYVDEEFLKFVMGTEPLSNFDSYLAQLKKMGIDSAVQMQQDALDRYYKR